MNNAVVVCRLEGFRDLPRDGKSFGDRYRSSLEMRREIFTLDEFHHESAGARARSASRRDLLDAVDGGDVRMIQCRESLGFTGEPRESLVVVRERLRQHLDRHVAIELRIPRAKDFAHPTRANRACDFIRAEASAGQQGHESTQSSGS